MSYKNNGIISTVLIIEPHTDLQRQLPLLNHGDSLGICVRTAVPSLDGQLYESMVVKCVKINTHFWMCAKNR